MGEGPELNLLLLFPQNRELLLSEPTDSVILVFYLKDSKL